jgi:hypothetical protein
VLSRRRMHLIPFVQWPKKQQISCRCKVLQCACTYVNKSLSLGKQGLLVCGCNTASVVAGNRGSADSTGRVQACDSQRFLCILCKRFDKSNSRHTALQWRLTCTACEANQPQCTVCLPHHAQHLPIAAGSTAATTYLLYALVPASLPSCTLALAGPAAAAPSS